MTPTIIRIPTPLRAFTGGRAEVAVEATTVGEALRALGEAHEGLLERILSENGELRGFVNVFLDEKNVRTLGGLRAELPPAAVLSIVPAVAGGRR